MTQLVEILCVGTELLIGKTLNTNAHWLAKRATTLGLKVSRITTVEDDVDKIALSVKEVMQRKNRFIVTVGGLGPTFDDKTLEGVAKALGCELEVHDQALRIVEEKYRRYVEEGRIEIAELTPHRVKMARLPRGARPLFNPVGTAPGVLIEREGTTLIALPGVPSEMKAIFEESVLPLFKEAAGEVNYFEASLNVEEIVESEVAPLIDQVMHDNPYVYIKSHPKGVEEVCRIELHLSTTAEDSKTAKNCISKALIQISELIKGKGGKVKPFQSKG